MAKKLGIFVSSDQHLDKIIKLGKAAQKKGIELIVFFTHDGVKLTKMPEFKELEGMGEMSLCNVCFEGNKLEKPIPVIPDDNFATQARHGELIEECDRYVSF